MRNRLSKQRKAVSFLFFSHFIHESFLAFMPQSYGSFLLSFVYIIDTRITDIYKQL